MNPETKSDTPETDAAIEQYAHLLPNWLATDIVGAVARKLERERDRMQALAGELIAMIRVNVMRSTFDGATIEQVDEHLKLWVERLQ